ncbi:AAA family ATPase [Planctomycetota bacterium]
MSKETLKSKRGSSRRKGDEYQDLTALNLIIDMYISGIDFEVFLEYEKTEAIDDIVIFIDKDIRAIQAKYAIDPFSVYTPDDFIDKNSRTYFGKFAKGWLKTQKDFSGYDIIIELYSNRGRDSKLKDIIDSNGCFTQMFIEGRKRKESGDFYNNLKAICASAGIDTDTQFQDFLSSFRFRLSQRTRPDLRDYIEGELLDHKLGISDRRVFHDLKELVEKHAIEIHDPITPKSLDAILRDVQKRFLLPQVFPVDAERFMRLSEWWDSMSATIEECESGYVVVTGLPGSGKSTSLSEFFNELEKNNQYATCRYYCFVSPNDTCANLRVEAEALRVNLLSEFQKQFHNILNRRHDYGEHRLAEVINLLASHLTEEGRKLVVLIDGLDHAERDPLVKESVLRALPTSLPKNCLFVIGTQELRNWEPLALHEGRKQQHAPMSLFSEPETHEYLTQRFGFSLDVQTIKQIQRKSRGLPLYLKYVASWLTENGGESSSLEEMPQAVNGDIRDYYERIWANLERDGMAHARHLCAVLSMLRFPVKKEELAEFQEDISDVDMAEDLRVVAHLLCNENGLVSIFHDSFRIFVNSKLDENYQKKLAKGIYDKLRRERGSNRWFIHVFHYALFAGEEDYILDQINRLFVDYALQLCRPSEDILLAIDIAVKAAVNRKDLIALARLGSLHFRTYERVEHQFDYSLLAKVQLALNRVEDVLNFCARQQDNRWLVNTYVAMQVMIWCAETNNLELGHRLYKLFRDTHIDYKWKSREEIEMLAKVIAAYSERPLKFLKWISSTKTDPKTLDRPDQFSPGFNPYLAAFLDAYLLYKPTDSWHRFKRIKRLFPNQLVWHYQLRLISKYRTRMELKKEVNEYLANCHIEENLEIAGYAALAGLPISRVEELAGKMILPSRIAPQGADSPRERSLDSFSWLSIVIGYINDKTTITRVSKHIGNTKTMWVGFLRFLLKAGLCLGQSVDNNQQDIYSSALEALDELMSAGEEDESRVFDTLSAIRPMLPEQLFRLTQHVAQNCQEKMDDWCEKLLGLRKSKLWTSHWGINEVSVDYTFELLTWDRIINVKGVKTRIRPILNDCANTYHQALSLKAGSRSNHFLWLAAIAASCGWREDAEHWKEKGTRCSLTYGYRKDSTIDYLIDVLELLTEYEPEHGLKRSAAILELAKWMGAATDGSETKHFDQEVFHIVLKLNRKASFECISFFRESSRWKMLECLEQYVVSIDEGDPEILWTLKDVFTPHYADSGRHPKQVLRVTQHLRDLAIRLEPQNTDLWKMRYFNFIQTRIDPSWWPEDVWEKVIESESREIRRTIESHSSSYERHKDYILDGNNISLAEITTRLSESTDTFFNILDQLRSENSYFHERDSVNSALQHHIINTVDLDELQRLWEFACDTEDLVDSDSLKKIAHRFFDFGDNNSAFESLTLAYKRSIRYDPGSHQAMPYIQELYERDSKRAEDILVNYCSSRLELTHGGFDLPRMIARYFAACQDVKSLKQVFNNYLYHCQELFGHLPQDNLFDWLSDYQKDAREESTRVVDLLIDLIGEPEIDQAKRLLRVLASLAKSRPDLICQICCQRMADSSPLLRERLGMLLETLACTCSGNLVSHLEFLLPLFEEKHFYLRNLLACVVHRISSSHTISEPLSKAASDAVHLYKSTMSYPPSLAFDVRPSNEFADFLKKGTLFSVQDKISGLCDLFDINDLFLLSRIENCLRKEGWSVEEAICHWKEDWDENARDGKVIWIVPRFHVQVSELLQFIIHELLEKEPHDEQRLEAMTNLCRCSDPDYLASLPEKKPTDIPALNIEDGDCWIKELQSKELLKDEILPSERWITIYEKCQLTQTEDSYPKYVLLRSVYPLLIAPTLNNNPEKWPFHLKWEDAIQYLHPKESLTLEVAKNRLNELKDCAFNPFTNTPFLPLVATHINSPEFFGYQCLAFLHPRWMSKYGMQIKGRNIIQDGESVARFEEWEEGYEDEAYCRDILSKGTRLMVKSNWLKTLISNTGYSLTICTDEKREFHKDLLRKDNAQKEEKAYFSVYSQ